MAGWEKALTDVETGEFVLLFGLALWQWFRCRARGAGWAAGSFGLLAAVSVTSVALTEAELPLPSWLVKVLLIALLCVPYALYRFAASFASVRGHVGGWLTAAAVLATVLLPYLPMPGQASPPGYLAFRILVCLQWGLLFGFVAVRMWRAGTGKPRAVRYRMRLLAVAATGLDVPVILGTLAVSTSPALQLASQVNAVVMAALFGLGLALPPAIRTWWRQGERNAIQTAVAELVSADTAKDAASAMLPHVAALTGAVDITLVDESGHAVAHYRAAASSARHQFRGQRDASGTTSVQVPVGERHRLVVQTDPYLPFFAREEFRLLTGLAEFVGLAIDRCELVEREREAQAQLAYQATHDALTGLPNRALFADRLAQALGRAERGSAPLAVMFLDLDRFKLINDGIDHAAGDEVLAETGRRLRSVARLGDTVARFGGDEFAVIAEVTDEDQAISLANRIRSVIAEPIFVGERDLSVSSSIGVVVTEGADDAASLVRDADAAMYQAKESGRDRVVLFGAQIRQQAELRLDIERDLRHALANANITAVYQPIVDLRSGGITGVEVLARWDHPTRGRLSPDQFLDVAEDTGLILGLGEQVLRLACQQAAHWASLAGPEFKVWVNMSAQQFSSPGLRDSVLQILDETGVAPTTLGIEITETVLMSTGEFVTRQLRQLRSYGVSIAIDDFGTGYSSLGYLARFPVNEVKIDRSFVSGIGEEPSTSLVTACLALSESLGLTTVAEGVETAAQADWLTQAGCNAAQGFHYARPLNSHQISNLLTHPQSLPSTVPTVPLASAV